MVVRLPYLVFCSLFFVMFCCAVCQFCHTRWRSPKAAWEPIDIIIDTARYRSPERVHWLNRDRYCMDPLIDTVPVLETRTVIAINSNYRILLRLSISSHNHRTLSELKSETYSPIASERSCRSHILYLINLVIFVCACEKAISRCTHMPKEQTMLINQWFIVCLSHKISQHRCCSSCHVNAFVNLFTSA